MFKSTIILCMILFSLLYLGCGSSQKNLSGADTGDIPEWFINTPQDPNYIFGAATGTSQDMQLAINKAEVEGRANIGRTLELKMNSLQKKFEEEVGAAENSTLLQQFTQATKAVVSITLSGSSIKEKKLIQDGNIWRAYVLIQYPLGEANQTLLSQIKKNEEMYTRFRSTQAFDELDKEVQKYDEFKTKQNMQ